MKNRIAKSHRQIAPRNRTCKRTFIFQPVKMDFKNALRNHTAKSHRKIAPRNRTFKLIFIFFRMMTHHRTTALRRSFPAKTSRKLPLASSTRTSNKLTCWVSAKVGSTSLERKPFGRKTFGRLSNVQFSGN